MYLSKDAIKGNASSLEKTLQLVSHRIITAIYLNTGRNFDFNFDFDFNIFLYTLRRFKVKVINFLWTPCTIFMSALPFILSIYHS